MSAKEERPLECGECKRPIKIHYKEIVNDTINCTCMCGECPFYQLRLHGKSVEKESVSGTTTKGQDVHCEKCGTSMEGVKLGQPLGCIECYSIFEEIITYELLSMGKIAPRMKSTFEAKKSMPLHIGKSPLKEGDFALSEKLTSLNEALNEALKKENYEQAAWLRDQIKSLMEKPENGKNKAT